MNVNHYAVRAGGATNITASPRTNSKSTARLLVLKNIQNIYIYTLHY